MEYYFNKKLHEVIDEFYNRLNKDREILSRDNCIEVLENIEKYCVDIDNVRSIVKNDTDLTHVFVMLTQMSIVEMIHIKKCEHCDMDNNRDSLMSLLRNKCEYCKNEMWIDADMESNKAFESLSKTIYIKWKPIIWEMCDCDRQVYDIRKEYCHSCEFDEKFPELKK